VNSSQVKVELVTPNGQTAVRGRHLAAKAQHHVSSRLLRRSRATVPTVRCCQRRAEPASSMGNLRPPGLGACRSGPSWPERSRIRRNRVSSAAHNRTTTASSVLIRHRRLCPPLSTEEAGDQFVLLRAAPKPASNRSFRLAAWSIHGAERTQSAAIRGKSTRCENGSDKPKWLLPTASSWGTTK
jgi:hypothetical protein